MSKSIANSLYRIGTAYHAIMLILCGATKGITRAKLVEKAMEKTGKTEKQASADVGVILSPTEGNRGNFSANGHLYYVPRETVKGSKRTLKYFRPVIRETPLEPSRRPVSEADAKEKAERAKLTANRAKLVDERKATLAERKERKVELREAKASLKELGKDKADSDEAKALRKVINTCNLVIRGKTSKLERIDRQLAEIRVSLKELSATVEQPEPAETVEASAETGDNERPSEAEEVEATEDVAEYELAETIEG